MGSSCCSKEILKRTRKDCFFFRSTTGWCFSPTPFFSFLKLLNTLVDKRYILLLVVLLNSFMTESSPTQHHLRHRHLRHTEHGHTDRLCDKPHLMRSSHGHEEECRQSRDKRDIHHMNLREGENSTICDYRVCVDKDTSRIPHEIHRVYCLEGGCRCQEEGAYRCTQLTDKVEVWYTHEDPPRVEKLEVEVGCTCAAPHALRLHNFNPQGVDR